MKLTTRLEQEHIESKTISSRFGEKILDSLKECRTIRQGVMAINSPSTQMNCARITELAPGQNEMWTVRFEPFSIRCFEVWDSRRSRLNMLVVELTHADRTLQMAFTPDSQYASKFTLSGPGTADAKEPHASVIASMLTEHQGQPVVKKMRQWIQGLFPDQKR